MANKRMFSIGIIDSDQFLDMSMEARLLYYDLGMRADDDGFVNSPKKIMRITKVTDKSLDELEDKGFIFRFASGVLVIRHWNINNNMRKDTYHETSYTEEKAQLVLDSASIYQLRNEYVTDSSRDYNEDETECAEDVSQIRLDKISLDKNSLDKTSLDERACAREEPSGEPDVSCALPPHDPTDTEPVFYFPSKCGPDPIYQSDIDNLTKMYNGSVDVRREILACAAHFEDKPNRVSHWQSEVIKWINRTINFNGAVKYSLEKREENYRTPGPNRDMEPDKVIETVEAGF